MYDVIVIGAGPSGSSVANIVASNNQKVLVLEKDAFPRYHIGESLIPFTYYPLKQLGVVEQLHDNAFTKKYSVQFVQPDGTEHTPFYFYNRYDKDSVAQTWQVERDRFDKLLADKAISYGAIVKYNTRVESLLYKDNIVVGVTYTDLITNQLHSVNAKIVVDASGRTAFASKKYKWQTKDPILSNKMSIWTYYKGCQRPEGVDGGATVVSLIKDKGWFWYIPLANDIVSIGVVADSGYLMRNGISNIKNAFERELQSNQWIVNKTNTAKCIQEHKCTTDYSNYSIQTTVPGLVLVGDAYAFLDPVFSSGVLLALKSGVMVGDIISNALKTNTLSTESFNSYTTTMNKSLENMRKIIYAFYNLKVSFKDIFVKHPWAIDKITDCLSGDLDKDYTDLWNIFENDEYTT